MSAQASAPKIVVGQVLHRPPKQWRDWTEFTVLKIGRKWLTLSGNARCTVDGLLMDCGGYAQYRLYVDKGAYIAEQTLESAWNDLRRHFQNMRRPASATLETIGQVRLLLRLPPA